MNDDAASLMVGVSLEEPAAPLLELGIFGALNTTEEPIAVAGFLAAELLVAVRLKLAALALLLWL